MAKQAARRKPRTKRDAAWPDAANHGADDATAAARPRATAGEGTLSSIGTVRRPKRSAVETERDAAIAMGKALTSGFQQATEAAVREAHAEGLAVPARVDGIAVEIRPDGEIVPIDDRLPWSPVTWRGAATR
ncbi:MAG TPA: hypothetical protein VHX39_22525 [Acetobacteraceae bacterium]|nr:hypothetical protein [Acetobacteraceae bacterium]